MGIPETLRIESRIPGMKCQDESVVDKLGSRTTLTCPECHGTLWRIHDNQMLRFRCHVGHAYTAECLVADQQEASDKALWVALRSLEESHTLALRMAARARDEQDEATRRRFETRARKAEENASIIRRILLKEPERSESV